MIGQQSFHAVSFAGKRHDCGGKTGLVEANLNPRDAVRAMVKTLLGESRFSIPCGAAASVHRMARSN
jgi:UTP-glucose-1-phosphate uridylyltransferase